MKTDPARWLSRSFLSVVAALVLGFGGLGCGGDSDGDGGDDGADYSGLSGVWNGSTPKGHSMTFTITVSRDGAIRGSMLDNVSGKTHTLTGEVDGTSFVMDTDFPDHFEGTVSGNTIRGTMTNLGVEDIGVAVPWTANKI